MKIAIPYNDGMILENFGRAERFKVYHIEKNRVTDTTLIFVMAGKTPIQQLLTENDISLLICSGIGKVAKQTLKEAGIRLLYGVNGISDEAVNAYLQGYLVYCNDEC